MKESKDHSKVSRSLVFKWHKRFLNGRLSLEDKTRESRPSLRASKEVCDEVRDVINPDRRLTVLHVAEKCGMSKTTSYDILANETTLLDGHQECLLRKI